MHMLGVVPLQRGRTVEGIGLIRTAIAINGTVVFAHINLGKALIAERRPDEALACFDRAIALDATSAEAHIHRGESCSACDGRRKR